MGNVVEGGSTQTFRILVIDDEQTVLKLVKHILNRAQFEVITTGTAEEGFKYLTESPFDCVITDAIMPDTNGYDLVKRIRQEPALGEIPILMLTRKRHRHDVKLAVDAGVTDYVLKPIDEHLLLDKVELCLKKGAGKRHIYEHRLHGEASEALIAFSCNISSLSETYLTVRTSLAIRADQACEIKADLFEKIGIKQPMVKPVSCEEIQGGSDQRDLPYEVKFTFMGIPESDLKKIRAWLHREEIRRRK